VTDTEVRTYELAFKDGGVARIDIPETWKITFGPVAGAKGVVEGAGFAFRAWQTEGQQRLLFTRVQSFRDVSLPMQVRAVRRFGAPDTEWFLDDGSWTGKKADLVERAWKPIDDVLSTDPEENAKTDVEDEYEHLTFPRAHTIAKRPR